MRMWSECGEKCGECGEIVVKNVVNVVRLWWTYGEKCGQCGEKCGQCGEFSHYFRGIPEDFRVGGGRDSKFGVYILTYN